MLFVALLFYVFPLSAEASESSGILKGKVIDAKTWEPIPYVYLHLEEINRTITTDRNGEFRFSNVPSGTITLSAHRIGYMNQTRRISITDQEENEITIELNPSVITGSTVEVVGQQEGVRGSNLEHASTKILGTELRRNLGTTLSETLESQPGFDSRSMGPAPGRPVIRGLGDYRVLILQDGERSGDASATSADHSVSIDPISANEIEIARGPAALVYGSNAIGGVINVVRDQIPTSVPNSITGSATLQGSSVNSGATAAGSLLIPYNNLAFNIDVNGRTGSDFNTPVGRIENSDLQSTNNAAGISYIKPWGYAGIAGSMYISNYGIPPDPLGGHPSGVNIEMEKFQLDGRSEVVFSDRFFKNVELNASLKNYYHVEWERADVAGTEFGIVTTTAGIKANHRGFAFFEEGIVGVWGEYQDFAVRGSRSPDSNSFTGSLFTVQEADFGPLHIEVGARFDHNIARPKEDRPNSAIGNIRQRSFSALSSSASAIYNLGRGFYTGAIVMHSYRAPALEELFSEGPHLAAYSYEIGNPDLDPERGLGKEIFLRYRTGRTAASIAAYHNGFSNYLYARDTGRPNDRIATLNDYQFVGVEAEIYGFESSIEHQFTPNLLVDAGISYTIGERNVDDDERNITGFTGSTAPLPMIPPLKASLGFRYAINSLTFNTKLRYASEQSRLGEFETNTSGYTLLDAGVQYRLDAGGVFHTFTFGVQNIFNETYRDHLSRIKDIFPEPGRNFNLLYRVYF
ncbi:MAG: TonB-dependent receptor [Balneolaceae bacterium]|nr:TonB-dependent receptor [Balneolaceae bacterium]